MDWMKAASLGFQNQSNPITTNQMQSLMTPEQKAKLEAQIKANNGGSFVVDPTPSAVPFDPQQLSKLEGMVNMSSPEDRAMTNDMRSLYKQLVPQVQQGIAAQEQNLTDIRNTPQGIDFTPMAALADKWSGGGNQLSTAAQSIKGMSDKEKLSLLMSGQNSIQDDQKALLSEIGSKLASRDNMKMIEAQMKNQRMLAGQDFTLMKDFNNKSREDVKPFYETEKQVQSVLAGLTPDANGEVGMQEMKLALSLATRALGQTGALTDNDLKLAVMPSIDTFIAQGNTMLGQYGQKIPYAAVKPLIDNMLLAQKTVRQLSQRKLQTTGKMYTSMGLNPEFVNNAVNTIYGEQLKQPSVEPVAAPQKPKLNIQDLLKE